MPQLVAFNRKWTIGSDDFVYPGIGEIILRFTWLIVVSAIFHYHKTAFDCHGGHLLHAYFIGLLSLLVVSIVMTAIVVYVSMQGTITNSWPRRSISKLVYVKCAISLPELAWNIMGTYWAFGLSSGCESHVVWTVKGVVVFGWIIGLVVLAGIGIVFDPLGALHNTSSVDGNESQHVSSAAKRVWETRCRILCCCVGCDEQSTNAFSGIADIFSNFFHGVDLVPTDIACGLILVHREQQKEKYRLSAVNIEASHRNTSRGTTGNHGRPQQVIVCSETVATNDQGEVNVPTPAPWMNIDLMCHYMKFAMASYGWPLYIFTHLMTGSCQLWSQCNYTCKPICFRNTHMSCMETLYTCLHSCKSQSMTVIDTEKELNELCLSLQCCSCCLVSNDIQNDNCCRCNTASIRKTTGVHPDDIVYASFHNKIYEIPFFVSVDRKHHKVVIAVRGTLSLKDVITDLTAECDTIEIDGLDNCVAHRGMLQAARYVQSTLDKYNILQQAFDRAQGAKLVITGHSLGAGTAALVAILLKPKYPDLVCFAFSPPGGLMSLCASKYCRDFICSVVLGKDIIPRLGIHTMEDLKTSILRSIHDCDRPKYKLLASGMWQMFCGMKRPISTETEDNERPLLGNSHNLPSYSNREEQNIENALQEAQRHSDQCKITHPQMYPPGQILQIKEKNKKMTCFGVPEYSAQWASVEDYRKVLVSPKMLSDHFPDAVMRALDQLQERDFTPMLEPRNSSVMHV